MPVDGSKARHKSTQQYYRDIQKLSDDLKAEVVDLQQQKETAREELRRAKKEIQTEKLKGAATTAATNIAESVGSLFGSNKVKTLERENTALHREVADHEETIEALQDRIQTMQADHSREIREMQQKHGKEIADKDTRHKQEISFLKTVIAKAAAWFPYFREMLRIENLCSLWDSMKGRPQRSSRESCWSMQENSIRRNISGNSRPKRQGFKW